MANIDTETSGLSELSQREDTGVAEASGGGLEGVPATAVPDGPPEHADLDSGDNALAPSIPASESSPTSRPTIVTAVPSGPSSPATFSAPHPKKFSSSNINKKFLQKNSSSPVTASPVSTTSSSNKASSPTPRPIAPLSASHSRLITTKLTAAPQPSTTTGLGWSRTSSVNHSAASSPSPVANASGPSVAPLPAAPQLPHVGKVIQPQHRAAVPTPATKKEGSGKTVWANVGSNVSPPDTRVQSDFPTAAEVANVTTSVRKAKLMDAKEAAENAAADKQARSVEADTFRGVHLDPNTHHWDEMEEDDDNFLDGVIEFGDGRQYKIQPADISPASAQNEVETLAGGEQATVPVSKEERFADDFDRSWPRSKTSPAMPPRIFPPHAQHPVPPSPSSSHTTHSPQDASRVLFNERSNRLEPYSSSHPSHRTGPGPGPHPMHRRGSHAESGILPADPRGGRDLPPHSQASNVQLLQKQGLGSVSPSDAPTRSGPFGPIPAGSSISFSKDRPRDRDPRRQLMPLHVAPGKDQLGPTAVSPGGRDPGREFIGETRGRRLSNMGPPPLPPQSLRERSKETGRQLPPHLPHLPQVTPSLQRRLSSREPQPRPPSTVPSDSPSSQRPSFVHASSQSPVLSHVSVVSDTPSQPIPPTIDLEQVHKTAMHLSAERAKQRRQQEEEEREKEKERARQKAAEMASITEKPSISPVVETKPSESEVTKFLEDVVKDLPVPEPAQPVLQRPPSLRAAPRSVPSIRPSQPAGATAVSPAVEADSWRSKSKVLPSAGPRQIHVRPSGPGPTAPPVTPKVPPPMLHGVESFAVRPDEDLEVVDFSDMGKFVGVAERSPSPSKEVSQVVDDPNARPPRPVASDFFNDGSSAVDPVAMKSDTGPWRRKLSHELDRDPHSDIGSVSMNQPESAAANVEQRAEAPPVVPEALLGSPTREKLVLTGPQSVAGSIHTTTGPGMINGQQRTTRTTTTYREATMSALDDVISRIKGALDDMQTPEKVTPMPTVPKPLSRESKWVTPALRVRNHDFDQQPQEIFDSTMPELPRTPPPAWNAFAVNLPTSKSSRPLEPLTKKHSFKNLPDLRLNVLSLTDLFDGTDRRQFALNDLLFGKPRMFKGKFRYTVMIPKPKSLRGGHSRSDGAGPKVHLPSNPIAPKINGVGAFGRPGGAVDQSTWRKSTTQPAAKAAPAPTDAGLNTVSRSPPPEPVTNSGPLVLTESASASARSRSQPKMPAGSAVAFYRDSRVDSVETGPKSLPSVSFTVSSELEENQQSKAKPLSNNSRSSPLPSPSPKIPNVAVESTVSCSVDANGTSDLKSQPASPEFLPALVQSKAGSKSSEDSTDRAPITPPSQPANATWAKPPLSFPVKESPARAPDPEHLKAVWSQPSDKARVHAVNSLEGIADDLTALPFTLQDVKSEDGETPPPTGSAGPSRMSLHDVTRAFQQVPSSSSTSATQRSVPISPSSASGPVVRPPNFAYSIPPNSTMRPSYAAYPSPIMSHTPSPTLMYSHAMAPSPVPSRMPVNGHPQMFNQVWMPPPAPPTQPHVGMIRPGPSPYPQPMIPYPSPGGPSMYSHPPTMQSPGPQPNGATHARGRGMPPMSPAMQHVAAPHVYPSPVLMHTPGMHSYMNPVPTGRAQLRNDLTGQSPMHPPSIPHRASHPIPASHPGYASVPPTSFAPGPGW